jgi:predicted phosphate transport protein (TIGR00153 family)
MLLFKKTKELELQLDEYLDLVVEGGLLFKQGIRYYLQGHNSEFEDRLKDLDQCESKADGLRRAIESRLYLQTLIPESRGDVLGILESTDRVLNLTAETLLEFSVESPNILSDLHSLYLDLAGASIKALDYMVAAIRAYFRDLTEVRDHINKAQFYEHESDKIAEKIKRLVFKKDIELSYKLHMRYFVIRIDKIADRAEDVCDRLSIATIKRYV